ncbi:sulfur carrier protein ThiS adenylyltransferase ThiF [Desulfofalx alkaliphila]|uniref:sulfur carrier protein ThiS adenylyltransferase ThiF n=1 Tax=Desulfofalx alkaliphila TaxID=105483 RepID=UPI0006922E2F|nr:sulfur carrier protein ThiS adenylyltransferase ThiF [Desulfofalx alkaliphila]
MNQFEQALEHYMGKENLQKIQQVTVGIAGAGGLGSNCAQYLVRSGFKNLVLVDYDRVEDTNLNRQFFFLHQVGRPKVKALEENLLKINPHLNIVAMVERLTPDNMGQIFQPCQVVVEAFDDPVCKRQMVEIFMHSDKLLVAASGLAGWGNSDDIKVRRVKANFYLVGDQVSAVSETKPPVAPRVNIVAAKQADVVLDYVLMGRCENTEGGGPNAKHRPIRHHR